MYQRKLYRCGKLIFVEKTITRYYPKGEARSRRRKPTPEEKKKDNERAAIRKLNRKIAANFEDGYLTTLTYGKTGPPTPEGAKELLKKFIGRLRREYRKQGRELKYIVVTEYRNKRIHHHMIINSISQTPKLLRKCWPHGRPDMKMLDEDGDYQKLAEYLVKETTKSAETEEVFRQRYSCSRNLLDPAPEVKRIRAKTFRQEPKPLKGYEIIKDSVVQGENCYGYRYQYYTMIKIDRKGGKDEQKT